MEAIIEQHKVLITSICKELKIKYLYVFGSAVNGKFNKESDLDFIIKFEDTVSSKIYTENYFKFHTFLRNLFNRKIDLLTERSIKNPYFKE